MITITIDQIVAEQARLAHLIAQLQTPASRLLVLPETGIELRAGERYAGRARAVRRFPA